MTTETTSFGFPLAIDPAGRVRASGGDEAIRGKIIQLLFTAPGERVNQPTFGCGLFNLVFEPNNEVLGTAMEFTVNQALIRWLGDEILPEGVNITREEAAIVVEIAYRKKQDLARQAVRIHFR